MRRVVIVLLSIYLGYCVLVDISSAKLTLDADPTNLGAIILLCTRAGLIALTTVIVWIVDLVCTIDGLGGVAVEE